MVLTNWQILHFAFAPAWLSLGASRAHDETRLSKKWQAAMSSANHLPDRCDRSNNYEIEVQHGRPYRTNRTGRTFVRQYDNTLWRSEVCRCEWQVRP